MAQACGIETFAEQTEMAIHRQDNRAAFNALSCPTLLLNGAQDVISTPHHHQLLAAGNANVTSIRWRLAGILFRWKHRMRSRRCCVSG